MTIQKSYNDWAKSYDSMPNKTRDLEALVIRAMLSQIAFNSVLEIGCGTGKNTSWLAEKSDKLVAADFSQKMIEIAKARIQSPKVSFLQFDLNCAWEIENNSVDLITCSLVLEHIENLSFIFAEASNKLEPNGRFYICELHPFKQYLGSKAKFETKNGVEELEVFVHHVSDYLEASKENMFKLIELNEWFDENEKKGIPRLISFIFEKCQDAEPNRERS